MAIQFNCVGCGKPVEVDDQWGGRLVECPYCHDTITAPAFPAHTSRPPTPAAAVPSAAAPASMTRTAHPAPGVPPAYPGEAYAGGHAVSRPAASGKNSVAVVALVLAILSVAAGFAALFVVALAMTQELGTEPTEEQVDAFMQTAMQQGSSWVLGAGVAAMASFGLWLGGLVCAIVGVCRPRKGVAIAALAVLGFPLLLAVVSLAFA